MQKMDILRLKLSVLTPQIVRFKQLKSDHFKANPTQPSSVVPKKRDWSGIWHPFYEVTVTMLPCTKYEVLLYEVTVLPICFQIRFFRNGGSKF